MERATNSSLILYTTEDGLTKIEATFDRDTVWLSIDQMADLFQRNKSTVSRHIGNIYKEGELDRTATVAKFATVASFDSSPSSKIFFKCLLIVDLLTPNNSAIAFCDSQTDSSLTIALTETSSSDER